MSRANAIDVSAECYTTRHQPMATAYLVVCDTIRKHTTVAWCRVPTLENICHQAQHQHEAPADWWHFQLRTTTFHIFTVCHKKTVTFLYKHAKLPVNALASSTHYINVPLVGRAYSMIYAILPNVVRFDSDQGRGRFLVCQTTTWIISTTHTVKTGQKTDSCVLLLLAYIIKSTTKTS